MHATSAANSSSRQPTSSDPQPSTDIDRTTPLARPYLTDPELLRYAGTGRANRARLHDVVQRQQHLSSPATTQTANELLAISQLLQRMDDSADLSTPLSALYELVVNMAQHSRADASGIVNNILQILQSFPDEKTSQLLTVLARASLAIEDPHARSALMFQLLTLTGQIDAGERAAVLITLTQIAMSLQGAARINALVGLIAAPLTIPVHDMDSVIQCFARLRGQLSPAEQGNLTAALPDDLRRALQQESIVRGLYR
jgi:hypothetical protein